VKNIVFNGKVLVSIVFTALLLSAMPVSAIVYNVGVKAGDWARYATSSNWHSTKPGDSPGGDVAWLFYLDSIIITVQDISGKTITAQVRFHFNQTINFPTYGNIRELNLTYKVDISTGSGNGTTFFSSKDLRQGDVIPGLWAINETILRSYAGVTREVNHLSRHETGSTMLYSYTFDSHYYFDRETGIICEASGTYSAEYSDRTVTYSFNWVMTETNMFNLPPPIWTQWWLWLIIVVVVVVIASTVIIIKRRKKPPPIIIAPPETKPA
jgi:hypothetical protein